jgi:hypothetical protein
MITLAGTRGSQPNALNRGVPPSAIGDRDMILPTYVLYKLAVLIGPSAIQLMRDRGCPIAGIDMDCLVRTAVAGTQPVVQTQRHDASSRPLQIRPRNSASYAIPGLP